MAHSQQRLKSISIDNLRRIKKLDISFEDKNVTAIFGANGAGKTTLLHTLLCLYRQPAGSFQYNFGSFFKRCKEGEFNDTKIEASVHFRNGKDEVDKDFTYQKSPESDRWTPKTSSRPERHTFYFGINTCVPLIEDEIKITGKYKFEDDSQISDKVCKIASHILGIQYDRISHKKRGKKIHYHATVSDGPEYYSISMGAGEQRVLRILEFLENVPKYSLIIIDEIDLTLHTAALNRLLDYLVKVSDKEHLQIVFTSHREELTTRTDINIRHIFQSKDKTICLSETRADCLDRLTGNTSRPLEIYVEDDLADIIVAKCSEEIGIRQRVSIKHYGSCSNAFVVSSALHLMGIDMSSILFVLDGDLYTSDEERLKQIEYHYSGNEPEKDAARNEVLNSIKSFNLPNGYSPEQYICSIIKHEIIDSNLEIREAANKVIAPADNHDYLNKIIEIIGEERRLGLYRIIMELSKHDEWNDYVRQVKEWLCEQKNKLGI